MTITCPNCGTSYDVDAATFPPAGRKVRCARCREIWHAELDLSAVPAQEVPGQETPGREIPGREIPRRASPRQEIQAQEVLPPEPPPVESLALQSDLGAAPIPQGARIVEDGSDEGGPASRMDVEQAARARDAARRAGRPKRRAARRGSARLGPVEAALIGAAFAVAAAAVYYREDMVRTFPSAAALYELVGLPVNLRGLEFANLKYRRDFEDGIPVLILEGEIVNIRKEAQPVPAIRFGLRGRSGEEIYAWSVEPRQKVIEPAAVMPFRTRLASPPRAADTVQMRFMDRGRRIVEAQQ